MTPEGEPNARISAGYEAGQAQVTEAAATNALIDDVKSALSSANLQYAELKTNISAEAANPVAEAQAAGEAGAFSKFASAVSRKAGKLAERLSLRRIAALGALGALALTGAASAQKVNSGESSSAPAATDVLNYNPFTSPIIPATTSAPAGTLTVNPNTAPADPKATQSSSSAPKHVREDNKGDKKLGSTVNSAIKHIHTDTDEEYRHFVIESYYNQGDYNNLKVSHEGDRMSSLKDFDKNSSIDDMREAAWLTSMNSNAYRAGFWNKLKGKPVDAPIPKDVSPTDQLKDIFEFLSSKDLKVDNVRMTGVYANGAISDKDGHRYATPTAFNNVRGAHFHNGKNQVLVKIGGGSDGNEMVCLNLEDLLHIKITPEVPAQQTAQVATVQLPKHYVNTITIGQPKSNVPKGNPKGNPNPGGGNPNPPTEVLPIKDAKDGHKPGEGAVTDDDPLIGGTVADPTPPVASTDQGAAEQAPATTSEPQIPTSQQPGGTGSGAENPETGTDPNPGTQNPGTPGPDADTGHTGTVDPSKV